LLPFAAGNLCLAVSVVKRTLDSAARPVVVPSLLLCDFGHLEREVRQVEEAAWPLCIWT
jgi:hypothetical protein